MYWLTLLHICGIIILVSRYSKINLVFNERVDWVLSFFNFWLLFFRLL